MLIKQQLECRSTFLICSSGKIFLNYTITHSTHRSEGYINRIEIALVNNFVSKISIKSDISRTIQYFFSHSQKSPEQQRCLGQKLFGLWRMRILHEQTGECRLLLISRFPFGLHRQDARTTWTSILCNLNTISILKTISNLH